MKQLKEIAYDALPIVVILGIDLLFFYRAILYGEIFFERDTRVFYYPIMSAISGDIRNWSLPLWSPNIFGGFPLFADGEARMFYPPVVALVYFLPAQQAFIWVTVSHFFMAGLFTYAFLRSLKLGRFGALVGGIAFMLGGFTVAQLHHVNLSNSAVWLPLILCFIERSLQSVGARRHVNLLLAGGAFGLQSLAVHVNVPLMSLPVILSYTAFRIIFGPIASKRNGEPDGGLPRLELVRWYDEVIAFAKRLIIASRVVSGRLVLLIWALSVVPLTGFAIAAVQLFPLYELGNFSRRAGGLDYSVASSQAQTIYNLVTLLFPYFFRDPSNVNWGLWSPWETRIYVGILPLLLGLTAIVLVRSRLVLFFAAIAVMAFLIGLADSAPGRLYAILSSLPAYNLVRAPGRYSYLWTFSNAVLAAYAANWLSNPTMGQSHFRLLRERWKPDNFLWRLPGLIFFTLLAAGAAEMPAALQRAAEYVGSHKEELLNLIQQNYLSLPRMLRPAEYALTPGRVYDALAYSLSFDNPSARYGLVMIGASAAMLLVGYGLRKAKWLWQMAVIALVAGDLTMVGWQFHPTIQIDQLASASPAADFLKEQQGLDRVYSRPGTPTDPNLLLPMGVAEANGYSSLQFNRQAQFAALMEAYDNQLMDIFNVRYIVTRNRYVPLPSYESVAFQPNLPLIASKYGNPASRVILNFPASRVDRLRVLSHLQYATQVPQGTPVAEITLIDGSGKRYTSNLLAGVHTAEWAYDRTDVQPYAKHSKPAKIAFSWPSAGGPLYLYFAEIRLDKPVTVQQVEIAASAAKVDVRVFGLTLVDSLTYKMVPLTRNNSDRFKTVYRDAEVVVRENTRYLPRTYLVPEVRVISNPYRIMGEMAAEPFDASKAVIIEEKDEAVEEFLKKAQGEAPPANIGGAAIESYQPQQIRISANANADAFLVLSDTYYPGWHALVDGKETKIYQANYLFRAIKIPKGTHDIQFVFAPSSFQKGLRITLTATVVVLAAWVALRLAWVLALARSVWPVLRRRSEKPRAFIEERVKTLFPRREPAVR